MGTLKRQFVELVESLVSLFFLLWRFSLPEFFCCIYLTCFWFCIVSVFPSFGPCGTGLKQRKGQVCRAHLLIFAAAHVVSVQPETWSDVLSHKEHSDISKLPLGVNRWEDAAEQAAAFRDAAWCRVFTHWQSSWSNCCRGSIRLSWISLVFMECLMRAAHLWCWAVVLNEAETCLSLLGWSEPFKPFSTMQTVKMWWNKFIQKSS